RKTTLEISLRQVNTSIAFIPREVMPVFTLPLKIFNLFVPHIVRETMVRFPVIPTLNPSVSNPAGSRPVEDLRSSLVTSLAATEEIFRRDLPPNLGNMTMSHPVLG